MKRYITFVILVCALFAMLCSSCQGDPGSYQAFPCVVSGQEKWSMVTADGKVMGEEEFPHRPSAARSDRFWTQNAEGYWELYGLADAPKRIDDREYRHVSNFYRGKAIVAERDKPVTVIDINGRTLLSLDSLEGMRPTLFLNFNDGLAVFAADTLQGVVDYDGNVIVPAKYYMVNEPKCDRIVAFDKYFMADLTEEEGSSLPPGTVTVFDYSGQPVFTVSSSKYQRVGEFTGGYLPVGRTDGDDEEWGLLDMQGEVVVPPNPNYRSITSVSGTNFIYSNEDEKMGLRSLDGSIVIKPKYDFLFFLSPAMLVAVVMSDDADEQSRMTLINIEGEKVLPRTFADHSPLLDDRYIYLRSADDRWALYDILTAEAVSGVPRFSNMSFDTMAPTFSVGSDYIDLHALIKGARLTANSMDGITFQSSVQHVLQCQARHYSWTNQPQAADYTYTDEVSLFPTVEGEMISETVVFPTKLSHQTFREEKVIDFVWGYNYWYHYNKIPDGYAFTTEHPVKFIATFNNYGTLRGKLRPLFNELVKHFSAFGTVIDNNGAATLIEMANDRHALIALEPNAVKVMWGKLSYSDRNIYPYRGNKEELRSMFAEEEAEGDY